MLQQRKARNNVDHLQLPNGEMCSDKLNIKDTILNHFRLFLGTEKARIEIFEIPMSQEKVLPDEAYEPLCKEVTEKEIKDAFVEYKRG